MLRPKQTKFRKWRKYQIKTIEAHNVGVKFGSFGLQALEGSHITAHQIEATRRIITRNLKRLGRVWIRIFPHIPVTSKPTEVRMGKGKGSVDFWAVKVGGGSVIFELCGVTKSTAVAAFKTGGAKLPVKTRVFM